MKRYFFLLISFFNFSQIELSKDSIRNNSLAKFNKNYRSLTIQNHSNWIPYNKNNSFYLNDLTVDLNYSSKVPFKYNDGSLIPNVGFQQLLSFGFFFKYGPFSLQVNPEYLYAENKYFQGFWDGHYQVIIESRYNFWNKIDQPERFGESSYSRLIPGQSSFRINFNNLSLGFSTENIWWGPAVRNGIMLSNNARGFPHITFNSIEPFQTNFGNFEWQFLTGRLEKSGFMPSYTNFYNYKEYFFIPKKNDWRYFQGLIVTFSPSFIEGLSLGFSRWVQAYSSFITGTKDYFPVLDGLFRKNDKYGADIPGGDQSLEQQRDQAAGVFFRWVWPNANAEIYGEFITDYVKSIFSKNIKNNEDLKGHTLGLKKIFNNKYDFTWEWTKLSQSIGSLNNNSNMLYTDNIIRHGYTNYGEVMGASIGPGSNSQFISLGFLQNDYIKKIGLEIISVNNDWFIKSFESAKDYRRYWKEIYVHLDFYKKIKRFRILSQLSLGRILNYQWEIEDFGDEYYKPGKDITNFNMKISIMYKLD